MLEPAVGVRREIGVLAENLLRAHVLLQLGQKTAFADVDVERIERLHLIRLLRAHVTLAQGGHAEIHERMLQLGSAEPTSGLRENNVLLLHKMALAVRAKYAGIALPVRGPFVLQSTVSR